MQTKFKYKSPGLDLFWAILFAALILVMVLSYGLPRIESAIDYVIAPLYVGFLLLLAWVTYTGLKTYLKLRGHDRFIIMGDKAMELPESGVSLEVIRLDYAQIRDVFFARGRYGLPDDLIIQYGMDGRVCVDKDRLDGDDFYRICSLLKQALGKHGFVTRSP